MLDKNFLTEYLEPEIWTHLQEILDKFLPRRRILHVLKRSHIIHGVTESGEKVDMTGAELFNKKAMLERYYWADEIRVYTEEGLENYDSVLQKKGIYQMDTDEYLDNMYQELYQTSGICVYERKKSEKHIFSILKRWITEDGVYLYWVTKDNNMYFNCILVVEEGKIVRVTTSARYPHIWKQCQQVAAELEREFCRPVNCVIMDYNEF